MRLDNEDLFLHSKPRAHYHQHSEQYPRYQRTHNVQDITSEIRCVDWIDCL